MSSVRGARVFYCADCGSRSRCLPLHVVVLGIKVGSAKQLIFDLELCPPCKLAWVDHHFNRRRPGRRSYHEATLPYARLQALDADQLVTLAQWRRRPAVKSS